MKHIYTNMHQQYVNKDEHSKNTHSYKKIQSNIIHTNEDINIRTKKYPKIIMKNKDKHTRKPRNTHTSIDEVKQKNEQRRTSMNEQTNNHKESHTHTKKHKHTNPNICLCIYLYIYLYIYTGKNRHNHTNKKQAQTPICEQKHIHKKHTNKQTNTNKHRQSQTDKHNQRKIQRQT